MQPKSPSLSQMAVALFAVGAPAVVSAQGFAVVELFTSEGCSSCPPADELLSQIERVAGEADAQVFALSMHVDYWNGLGWTDPFSSPAMTNRQRRYAAAAGERGVYTPQMIVNGEDRFVGSNAREASRAINAAVEAETRNAIRIASRADGRDVVTNYTASGDLGGVVVNVALVQAQATREALRGENAGRTLRHVNVVRAFRSVDAERRGAVRIAAPEDFQGPLKVVVYLQSRETKRIVAAASTIPAS